ncbi:MAG TPA: hypothetical protein PK854_00905 [Oscillospiraceae bacterium]|nr:hypothetical protein [Oscillospiraceae bacterium]HPS33812.1 hypothetical protein [Oscillospiraceae bacterium]
MRYAILYHPGHNRVYFETALKLALSEFDIAAKRLSSKCCGPQNKNIGGNEYLVFETAGELSEDDIKIVSGLSFVYALFALEGEDGGLRLRPILRSDEHFVEEGISAMLKYTGKTNEIFTRMMINIARYSQPCDEPLKLLDPLAGKGTTLFEGLIKGYDVYGIEIGEKVTLEAVRFLQKFLETAKYKFEYKTVRISGSNKSFTALRSTFEIARNRQEQKEGKIKTAELIAGNAQFAAQYYKKNFFHMIVGDLPYGVQHTNVTDEKQSAMTRSPAELLKVCLPGWVEVLRPGGCMVLSWNSNVLAREKMAELFERKGLTVLNDGPYAQLEHRVDQAILRDIIVAKKGK